MSDETLLPPEVVDLWRNSIGRIPEALERALLHFGPHISFGALENIAAWSGDSELAGLLPDLAKLNCFRGEHSPKFSSKEHALYRTHELIAREGATEEIHDLVADLLGRVDPYNSDRATFYSDCLAVRRLTRLWQTSGQSEVDPGELRARFTAWVETQREADNETLADYAGVTFRLLRGERIAGVPKFHRGATYNGEQLARITPPPPPSAAQEHRYQPIQPFDDKEPLPSAPTGYAFHGGRPTNPHTDAEKDDPDHPQTFKRHFADQRTRVDDRRIAAEHTWTQRILGLRSEIDIHRLPLGHVAEAINDLYTKPSRRAEWAYTWILATTGLAVERLQYLRVVESSDTPWKAEHDCRLDLSSGILEVHLLDGPSGPKGATNRIVRIRLPSEIVDTIERLGDKRPFRDCPSKSNHRFRRAFGKHQGMPPRCHRIRATAEAHLQGLAHDESVGLALTGSFGHSSRGAAAYRQIQDGEIQDLHRDMSKRLRSTAEAILGKTSGAFPFHPRWITLGKPHFTGSNKVVDQRNFAPLFQALRQRVEENIDESWKEKDLSGVATETLIELHNSLALYSYLAALLATGIRPVTKSTVIHQFGQQWFVQDKNSPGHIERRLIPVTPDVTKQIDILSEITDHLVDRVLRPRSQLSNTLHETNPHFPRIIEPRRHGRWRVRRICQKDIDPHFYEHGWNRRSTRHTFTTTLRRKVPEAELHASLGHVGGGWQRESTASMATAPVTGKMLAAIEKMLTWAGFEVIDPRERYAV